MNHKRNAAIVAMMALALGGCATVMNGTKVDYSSETKPGGALVKFTDGSQCTTPCELEFKRKNDQRADITLAGYKPTYVLIQSKLGGSAFGNILLGGGIGAVVDGTNGSSNRLYPSRETSSDSSRAEVPLRNRVSSASENWCRADIASKAEKRTRRIAS